MLKRNVIVHLKGMESQKAQWELLSPTENTAPETSRQ